MNSEERWLEVKDFPDYVVSNLGRIKNTKTGTIRKLTPRSKTNPYLAVTLYNKGPITKPIHKLVAQAFIGAIPKGLEVNHIDGNILNNRSDNLEFLTPSKNVLHGYALGLMTRNGGLPKVSVKIIELDEIFKSIKDAAKRLGVRGSDISAVLHGRQKTVSGYHFERVD